MDRAMHELQRRFNEGKIDRRAFIRSLVTLGLSWTTANALAACARAPAPKNTPTSTSSPTSAPSPEPTSPPASATPTLRATPTPRQGFIPFEDYDPSPEATLAPATLQPSPTAEPAPPTPQPLVKRGAWLCACCGQELPTLDALRNHSAREHAWRLPEIRRVREATYEQFLTRKVSRFDQRDIVFARAVWDEEYQVLIEEAQSEAEGKRAFLDELEGSALKAGAIYVDETAGSRHEAYRGYTGHMRGVPGLYGWDEPVSSAQYPVSDPAQMSERVKKVGRFYGADLVGICKVDARWVYSHYFDRETQRYGELHLPFRYAIVMGVEMDWEHINESPGFEASAATALAYSRMAEVSASLAAYIRSLGYPAVPSANDSAQSIPLAIDAGLGELGRNGLLLTPQYGPRQRLCQVFTDVPLVPDHPIDFGLQSFCERCHVCAQVCPAEAIMFGERTEQRTSISNRAGIVRWPVDVEGCYLFWQENGTDCSNCVARCPWALHVRRDWI